MNRPTPQTPADFAHNIELLTALKNSKIQSDKVKKLIAIRTRIAEDAIKAEVNFLTHVTSPKIYQLCNTRLTIRRKMLDESGQAMILFSLAGILLIALVLIGILTLAGYPPALLTQILSLL